MKRSYLNRKTPIQRPVSSSNGLNRTWMRGESDKARKRREEAAPWRRQRVIDYPVCWLCGDKRRAVEIHEVARGSRSRHKSIDAPYATLVTCRQCHDEKLGDTKEWNEARQLALLKRMAPQDYDLAAYNFLVNENAPRRIEQHEVDAWENENEKRD